MNDLGEDSKVNLKPLGGGLVACAPGEAVREVDAGMSVSAATVPLGRVNRRRRQLTVVNRS